MMRTHRGLLDPTDKWCRRDDAPPCRDSDPSTRVGGIPSRARANASSTASSPTSICPKTRIKVATDRPDSSRKIRPIATARDGATPSSDRSGLDPLPGERSVTDFGLARVPERTTSIGLLIMAAVQARLRFCCSGDDRFRCG